MYYSDLKLFQYRDKLDQMREGNVTPPVHIRIKPTNTCNHRCWYCGYQSDTSIALGQEMETRDFIPREKMIEISNDLVEMGVKAVTFSGGGEPLTYRYIEEFAGRLLDGGVKVAMLTNGSLLNKNRAKVFADRATWVRVSMDGWDNESYTYYRGTKGSEYTKITDNLRAFASIKGKTVLGVSLNVDIKNAEHVYDFAAEMKDCGVDHLKVCGCIVSNQGETNNRYHAPFFKETERQIKKAQADFNSTHFKVFNVYHEMAERFDKSYSTCPFTQFLTIIGADLNIYTCQDKAYTQGGTLGCIRDKTFKELWADPEFHQALEAINPSKICNHHCVAEKKNRLILDYLNLDANHIDFV